MVKIRVIRLRGVEGRKARDQIAFYAFLVGVQTNAGYIRMRNINLEIRIAGSCRLQLVYLVINVACFNLSFSLKVSLH